MTTTTNRFANPQSNIGAIGGVRVIASGNLDEARAIEVFDSTIPKFVVAK
ncbi:hypothetical protein ABLN87_18340 [Ruegeria sp. SCPT10]